MNSSPISSKDAYVNFVSLSREVIQAEREKLASVLPISRNARTVFDLSEEERLAIEVRMKPEGWSGEGFLKITDRLLPVCIEDGRTLLREKISCYLIADVLSSIIEVAQKSDNPEPIVGGKFKVKNSRLGTNGYQECPFAKSEESSCHFGRMDPVITNVTNGISILANNLTIDMVRDHFFFQNGPYRLDPQAAIECLELQTTQYEMITESFATYRGCEILNDNKKDVQKYSQEKLEAQKYAAPLSVAAGVTGYILPFKDRDAYENHGLTVEQKIRKQGVLQGLTEEQIQSELRSHVEFSQLFCKTPEEILSEVIERQEKDGDQFLHVFNDEEREGEQIIKEMNGFKLSAPVEDPGIYVFELATRTRAKIAPDFTVLERASGSSQKKRRFE